MLAKQSPCVIPKVCELVSQGNPGLELQLIGWGQRPSPTCSAKLSKASFPIRRKLQRSQLLKQFPWCKDRFHHSPPVVARIATSAPGAKPRRIVFSVITRGNTNCKR